MEKNPYEAPRANLQRDGQHLVHSSPANPWAVAGFMLLVSIVFGLVIGGIEYALDMTIPGMSFISTALPSVAAGVFFARKHQLYMSKRTRILSVAYLFLITIFIMLPFLFIFDVMSMLSSLGKVFWLILLVVLPLMFAVSYFFIHLGEKMVLDKK